jgi:hypothetical protein
MMMMYIIVSVLFFIFVMYSVMLIYKGINETICIEPFTIPSSSFLTEIQESACSSNQKMYYEVVEGGSYNLQCINECSQSNVTFNDSNVCQSNWCKLDDSESNYPASNIDKCFVNDGFPVFHEPGASLDIGCDNVVQTCSSCTITDSVCASNAVSECVKTVTASIPNGFSRCTLDYEGIDDKVLQSDKEYAVGCSNAECQITAIHEYTRHSGDYGNGGSLAYGTSKYTKDVDGCKIECNKNFDCGGFSFNTGNGNECWLHNKTPVSQLHRGDDNGSRAFYERIFV